VLIFIAALGGTILWQRSQNDKTPAESTPTAATTRLYLFDSPDKIVFLRLDRVGDRPVELQRDAADHWEMTWPVGMAVDNVALEPVLSQLSVVQVLSTLEQPPAMDVLGLDTPAYRLLVKTADGSQALVSLGKETPTGSGYYALSGDRKIVVVDKNDMDAILKMIDTPPVLLTPEGTDVNPSSTPLP